ncbi:hypothetical protein EXIGLDRAFT_810395, partial [Exidia glandulosa HHB12029]
LLRDMPVRWSSTSFMLNRALELRTIVNMFIFELKEDEPDKKRKASLAKMLIGDDEWVRVERVRELFQLADEAQQMFSAERYPTLYNAMPAMLSLLAAWERRRASPKYVDFTAALDAAILKLRKHIDKIRTAAPRVSAYWVSMVLHPEYKLSRRFHKFWAELAPDLEQRMENLFRKRYEELHKQASTPSSTVQLQTGGRRLLDEFSDDEDSLPGVVPSASAEPYKTEYRAWLDAKHELTKDMPLVRMWGVHHVLTTQYPTWASLARDYLPVMGSSVSSERAFSGGGLVITDHRGSLKGDVVEALQSIKCALRNDLLVRAPMPSSVLEAELMVEDTDDEDGSEIGKEAEGEEWFIEIVSDEDELEEVEEETVSNV